MTETNQHARIQCITLQAETSITTDDRLIDQWRGVFTTVSHLSNSARTVDRDPANERANQPQRKQLNLSSRESSARVYWADRTWPASEHRSISIAGSVSISITL